MSSARKGLGCPLGTTQISGHQERTVFLYEIHHSKHLRFRCPILLFRGVKDSTSVLDGSEDFPFPSIPAPGGGFQKWQLPTRPCPNKKFPHYRPNTAHVPHITLSFSNSKECWALILHSKVRFAFVNSG